MSSPSTIADHHSRLEALRSELQRRNLTGFIIPITDEFMSEYVGDYAQRMAWLTGFGGSAGTAVVLADKAAAFVDGRYTLQVQQQVDGKDYEFVGVPQSSPLAWLLTNAKTGDRIGYDAWLHGIDWVKEAETRLKAKGVELVAVEGNPVDAVWHDQPAQPLAPAQPYADAKAGASSSEKRSAVADWLKDKGPDAVIISALDSVGWLFNLRGADVSRTPVAAAYAIVDADGTAQLFIAPEKVTPELTQHLGNAVRVEDRAGFAAALAGLGGKTVAVDPERAVAGIFAALEAAGATIVRERDPAVLAKAQKNPVEIAGHRAAQARDGVALARYLRWMEETAPKGGLDEYAAGEKLLAFRQENAGDLLRDLSFDTISASGPNGASPHYHVTPQSSRAIDIDNLYLVDSGGQYEDGTTDVTRTIAIGTPSAEMRHRFTLVLKGHIALATALFPEGTTGGQLDILARQFLWAEGLDYAHGTGHGVGAFLSVHEGPQRIAKPGGGQAGTGEPLRPGMILSNEPGYYKAGEYGIRIENLILVEPRETKAGEVPMMGFETLTFAPIDRRLIEVEILTPDERAWIDDYHAKVLSVLGPQMQGEDKAWLETVCAPL